MLSLAHTAVEINFLALGNLFLIYLFATQVGTQGPPLSIPSAAIRCLVLCQIFLLRALNDTAPIKAAHIVKTAANELKSRRGSTVTTTAKCKNNKPQRTRASWKLQFTTHCALWQLWQIFGRPKDRKETTAHAPRSCFYFWSLPSAAKAPPLPQKKCAPNQHMQERERERAPVAGSWGD